MFRIGIDPDSDAPGIAKMIDGKLIELSREPFLDVLELIKSNPSAIYSVENVEILKPTFYRSKCNPKQMLKIAQNVGMVKMAGRIITKTLDANNCTYELIIPLKGYIKKAKKDAKFFNEITGWTKKSNEDARDAALLLYRYLKQ